VIFYDLSGFLVRVGDKKILIDTLFDRFTGHNPPQEAFDLMMAGEPPFDQIDLVLTTHNHVDHFSAEVMGTYLMSNPQTPLISSYQVVEELTADGLTLENPIYSINIQEGETESVSLDGIEIECLYISHGDDSVLNLGFIVTVGEISFFHSGDMHGQYVSIDQLVAYGLPERQLDFALVVYMLLEYQQYHEHLTEGIAASYIIPTHYTYDYPIDAYEAFPDAVLFTDSLQSWQMP
jgi:L-ascorbate metabolism protein UlaG (beta-lactamase superfamily)